MEAREKGETEDTDAEIVQVQEAYFEDVASKVYPVLAMAKSYKKSYVAHNKKQGLEETLIRDKQNLKDAMPSLQRAYTKRKSNYKAHLESANTIVEWTNSTSWDLLAKSEALRDTPAASVRNLMGDALEALEIVASNLVAGLEAEDKSEEEIKRKLNFLYEAECKAKLTLSSR